MKRSLNEVEGLARKAARGAGLSWGLAEEAGKATRWLASAGLPGVEALAALLTQNDGTAYGQLCPVTTDGPWQAEGGTLCPLIAGAALCDRAEALAQGQTLTLQNVAYPVLLVPFVAAAAEIRKAPLSLRWDNVQTIHQGESVWLDITPEALTAPLVTELTVERCTAPDSPSVERLYRGEISQQANDTLESFAHRTYAPDTPESRMAGAGADASDND